MPSFGEPTDLPDSLEAWLSHYHQQVVSVNHPAPVAQKTLLHLRHFQQFLLAPCWA